MPVFESYSVLVVAFLLLVVVAIGSRKLSLFSLFAFLPFTEAQVQFGFKYINMFDVAAIVLIAAFIVRYAISKQRLRLRRYFLIFVISFFGWALLSTTSPGSWPASLSALMSLVFYAALAVVVYNSINSFRMLRQATTFWIIVMGVVSFAAIFEGTSLLLGWSAVSATATFGNRNQLANYLLPAALLGITTVYSGVYRKAKGMKILVLCATAAAHLAILLIQSRGAWIGLIAGYTCLLVVAKGFRKRIVVTAIAVMMLMWPILLTPWGTKIATGIEHRVLNTIVQIQEPYGGVLWRMSAAGAALQVSLKHPFLGIGFGRWLVESPVYLHQQEGMQTHNTYLGLLVETGMIGLGMFLLFLGTHMKRALMSIFEKRDEKAFPLMAGLLASLIAVLVHLTLFDGFLRPNLWLLLAFGMKALSVRKCDNVVSDRQGEAVYCERT